MVSISAILEALTGPSFRFSLRKMAIVACPSEMDRVPRAMRTVSRFWLSSWLRLALSWSISMPTTAAPYSASSRSSSEKSTSYLATIRVPMRSPTPYIGTMVVFLPLNLHWVFSSPKAQVPLLERILAAVSSIFFSQFT